MPQQGPTLIYPPFPRLTWEEPSWTARVALASWRDFQPAYEPDATPRRRKGAAAVRLTVSLPDEAADEGLRAIPSPEQAAAYGHLLDKEAELQLAVLRAIVREYPAMRQTYEFWGGDEEEEEAIREKIMPVVRRPEDLRSLIGLREVHVLPASKAGVAYVGLEFDCTWDGEHGLGVLTHKGRAVEVGGADVSFDWTEEDAGPRKKKPRKRGG